MKMALCTALAVALMSVPEGAMACTRIFWNDNGKAMLVARTMDLGFSDQPRLVVYPRGIPRTGLSGDGQNPLRWTSRYGSVAVTAFGEATTSGMNEKGLAADLLSMEGTVYEARDPSRPGVSVMWAQYFLDTCATVQEALSAMEGFQVVPQKVAGRDWPLHLSLEDATGDSAVVEFLNGSMTVHHGREFTVLTNEPPLQEQIANLRNSAATGGFPEIPMGIDPKSRFVRASAWLEGLPRPRNGRQAAQELRRMVGKIALPPGSAPGCLPGESWHTRWIFLADLTDRIIRFQTSESPSPCWISFDDLNLKPGAPVLSADAGSRMPVGSLIGKLKP